VGVIIGAGIYILIGPATERAGGLVWLALLTASALCALTAFSYMELTSMFPKACSEHEFARQVLPDWVAFTTGWSMAVALVRSFRFRPIVHVPALLNQVRGLLLMQRSMRI
jgi:APA family basic amino acid/polyamine antiporter